MIINSVGMLLNQMKDYYKKKEEYYLVINLNGTWHFTESNDEILDEYMIVSNEVGRIFRFIKSLNFIYADEAELWKWVMEIINMQADDFYYDHDSEHVQINWIKELRYDGE